MDENAVEKRNEFKNPIISVTGTCGKTTTCKFVYDILKNFLKVSKTRENCNSYVGIPWCINEFFRLDDDYWIIEIGISRMNEMKDLLNFVRPDIRIITNIGEAHSANFDSIQDYVNEKLEFTKNIKANSENLRSATNVDFLESGALQMISEKIKPVLIINNDDNILNNEVYDNFFSLTNNISIIRCGTRNTDDVQLVDYVTEDTESIAKIRYKNEIISLKIEGIGKYNAINLCLAVGCAIYLGVDFKSLNNSSFSLYDCRGRIYKNNQIVMYDHSYNCAPTSITNNLEYFKNIKSNNKIIVLGDMGEISDSKNKHEIILKECVQITNNIYIFSKKEYKNILDNSIFKNCKLFESIDLLNNDLKIFIDNSSGINSSNTFNDKQIFYILVQGSNSSNLCKVSAYIKKYF
jgi:UDP-N-acetylmuramoyl-tripeptide--D-alanyl-D-alanine ligase